MSDTFDRVKKVIAEHLNLDPAVDPFDGTSRLVDDLGADSLDLVEITMELEEEFDLEISDEKAENIQTVDDAVTLINQLTAD